MCHSSHEYEEQTNKQTNKQTKNNTTRRKSEHLTGRLGGSGLKPANWHNGLLDMTGTWPCFYVQGYQRDFTVGVVATPLGKCVHNLKSTDEHPQVVQDYIEKELQAGRIGGRLLQPPSSKYQMSPFGRERQGKLGLFTVCHTGRYRCER